MTNRQTSPLLLFLGFAALGAACQKNQPVTEIILEIGTNIPVPAEMDSLSIQISTASSGVFFNKAYSLGTGPGQMMLSKPKRMTLAPSDTATTITVQVDGLLAGVVIVSRTAIASFAPGESGLLRIDLLRECEGTICPARQTCVNAGLCTDANTGLTPFDPGKSPDPAPPDRDSGAPSAGKDGQAADGLPGAGGDGPPNLTDVARDLGVDRPPNLTDAASDVGADGLVAAPTDAMNDGQAADGLPGAGDDGPPDLADAARSADGLVATDGSGPDVPASKPNGATCTSKAECQSGSCVDGFCCNSDCSGTCMSCKVSGSAGTCSLVPLNDSSDGDCPDEGAQTCGRNGKCDGAGGCMLYQSGTGCSAETCPAGSSTHTRPGLCDGHGVCAAGQLLDCAPFMCNSVTNACYANCSTGGSECKPPGQCTNGSCGKKSNGQTCVLPSECTSNFCEQGVCCGGACQGLCTSCAVDGSLGTCSAVKAGKADPQSRCHDKGVAGCGTNGSCDGSGACQNYATGLQCQATCDPTGTTFSTFTCNGSGACGLSNTQPCAPYHCDASGCKKSCTVPTDCASGYLCSPSGTCVLPTTEDCMNGIDDDGNGQIDCADPACNAGYMCVPQLPSGFTGPGEVYDGPGPSPPCDPLYTTDYLNGFATPQCPVSCTACTCGSPANVTCGSPGIASGTGLCQKPYTPVAPGVCTAVTVTTGMEFATMAGEASGGSCTAFGGTVTPFTGNTGHLCQANATGGKGCPSGYVCWPKPQSPFPPQACVFATGDLSCPSTGYTVKRNYYKTQDVNDTRACSACPACGAPSGGACSATLGMWTKPSLGTATCVDRTAASYTVPSTCQAFPANIGAIMFSGKGYTGGSCAPTGQATATGACTPLGAPTTACCTP
jgi:hypothetical protein